MLANFNKTRTSDINKMQACLASQYPNLSDIVVTSDAAWTYRYNQIDIGSIRLSYYHTNDLSFTRNCSNEIIVTGLVSGSKIISFKGKTISSQRTATLEPLGRVRISLMNSECWTLRVNLSDLKKYNPQYFGAKTIEKNINTQFQSYSRVNDKIYDLVHYIISLVDRYGPPDQEEAKLIEKIFYLNFIAMIQPMNEGNKHETFYKKFSQCVDYIDSKIDEKITTQDLARIANCSVRNLHYIFNDLVGCSIMKFVTERRLQLARNALQSGDPSINVATVRFSVGIESESYFSKIYNRRFGELPSVTLRRSR